jgi:hypothetical protein
MALGFGAIALVAISASVLGLHRPKQPKPGRECPHCLSCRGRDCLAMEHLAARLALPRRGQPSSIDMPAQEEHVEALENQPTLGGFEASPDGTPASFSATDGRDGRSHIRNDVNGPRTQRRRRFWRTLPVGPPRRRTGCARPRGRRGTAALPGRPESGAAASGGGERRAGARARRRRDRQDSRADHAHRPHHRHRPRLPLADPGGDLHQQGSAGDEGAHCAPRRSSRREHAVAGNLPRDRNAHPAPACRTGGAAVRLHHPRHRRPDPPDAAGHPGRRHRREALARTGAGVVHRRLEEPRPDPRQGPGGRGRRLRRRARRQALRGLSGAVEAVERRRLRRPADRVPAPVPRASGRARRLPGEVQVHPGGRVSGHQCRPVPVAAPAGAGPAQRRLRRRRRPVDLRLARRRGRQHPALREGFSRRHGGPAGAQLQIHRPHPRHRRPPDRA